MCYIFSALKVIDISQ
jgi:hypothetical protein